jgi:predicted Rossmann-fold nucleotide-binding protein
MSDSAEPSPLGQVTKKVRIKPEGALDFLSLHEIHKLRDSNEGGLYNVFRRCALAVLNTGNETDSGAELLRMFPDFDIQIVPQARGVRLEVSGAPETAFADDIMLQGIREHLFSVLRDIVYVSNQLEGSNRFNLESTEGITDFIFHILRNAGVLEHLIPFNLVVCWGGHSINYTEYQYTKQVGYQLGLRGFNICTGCGPGAMKGPMKGAAVGHAKQRNRNGRYIGLTEPGIIASEAPNPMVNTLVIMPDIEKRLEAFVRMGHGFIIFPGGAGTAEEILYILGILMHPENQDIPFPLILTGPRESASYFEQIDRFIVSVLGEEVRKHYQIIIDDPKEVARQMQQRIPRTREFRRSRRDAYYFNWTLHIAPLFQQPFLPTHENMKALNLMPGQEPHVLAAQLRCMFSGIVSGNIKDEGVEAVRQKGPFQIHGKPEWMAQLDQLLQAFCDQNRMKLPGMGTYQPCYEVVPGTPG